MSAGQRQYGQLQLEMALERQLGQKAQSNVTRALVRKRERRRRERAQRRQQASSFRSGGSSDGSLSVAMVDSGDGSGSRWSDALPGDASFATDDRRGSAAWSFESMALLHLGDDGGGYPLFDAKVVPATGGWLRGVRGARAGQNHRDRQLSEASAASAASMRRSAVPSPFGSHRGVSQSSSQGWDELPRAATAVGKSDTLEIWESTLPPPSPGEEADATAETVMPLVAFRSPWTSPAAPPERIALYRSFNPKNTPAAVRSSGQRTRRDRDWQNGHRLNKIE